jgi:hypothetical protein
LLLLEDDRQCGVAPDGPSQFRRVPLNQRPAYFRTHQGHQPHHPARRLPRPRGWRMHVWHKALRPRRRRCCGCSPPLARRQPQCQQPLPRQLHYQRVCAGQRGHRQSEAAPPAWRLPPTPSRAEAAERLSTRGLDVAVLARLWSHPHQPEQHIAVIAFAATGCGTAHITDTAGTGMGLEAVRPGGGLAQLGWPGAPADKLA